MRSRSAAATVPARTSVALDNLRAVVILLVLAFHSVLAYLAFLPHHPFAFASPPYLWRAIPIVDPARWMGFDLFCAWLDVYLMTLFFFLSGLFVWPSLTRRGPARFLYQRLLRLGLPFALVVGLLMPAALYPSYLQTAAPGFTGYWRDWLALPFWPCGPVWFLWLLLAFDVTAASLGSFTRTVPARLSAIATRRPAAFLAGLILLSALAYVPLALGFGPSRWAALGPFAWQVSRPLHYALYFFAGAAVGAGGIERGLLAPEGKLARCWAVWAAAAGVLFLLWMAATAPTMPHPAAAPVGLRFLAALGFVTACFSSCFAVLAVTVRFAGHRLPRLESIKNNAYGMYLVHYLFVVWLQYGLLSAPLPAIVKGATVFAGTLVLSWGAVEALRRVPAAAQIIGARRVTGGAAPGSIS